MALGVKNLLANAREVGSIPGWVRSPREGLGNPLQYSWRIPWTEEPGGPHTWKTGHLVIVKKRLVEY